MFFSVVRLSERLDWGFGNPNVTGTYIATLIVSAWVLPVLVPSRRGRWAARLVLAARIAFSLASLAVSGWLAWKELQTGSRGGAAAAFVGIFATLAAWVPRWNWRRVAGGAALVVIAAAAFFASGKIVHQAERLSPGYSVGDASIGNRLRIWKWTPAMMENAPGGWGLGRAPKAFMAWYQDADHLDVYAALVNSHLEWLVEFNWFWRLAYLLGWALAFRLAWPPSSRFGKNNAAFRRFCAVTYGTWMALATGSFFSTVANEWPLWVVPAFLFVVVLWGRFARWGFPSWRNLLATVAAPSAVVMVALLIAGAITSPMMVRDGGAYVKIGKGAPEIVILSGADAKETVRQFRTFWRQRHGLPTVLRIETQYYADKPGKPGLPGVEKLRTLALLGHPDPELGRKFSARAGRILVFGAAFAPDEFLDAEALKKTQAVSGEFSSSSHILAWQASGRLAEIPGAGDFLEDWMERIVKEEPAGEAKNEGARK
ncbi:MAG: O-antigen ligase family protein [Puniceicoccales bacterium]|jgi:hypothetical protein|nr:O-antigen ligase family protein [Puniceicoccales bacterium]